MFKNSFLIFIFSFSLFSAQSKLIVKESHSEKPISNALVFCNGKLLGKTNAQGTLNFKTKCREIDLKAAGYYDEDAVVDKLIEVSMEKTDPSLNSIEKIVVQDRSDPRALEILKKVNEKFKENSPNSLDSYAFKSYERITFDFDEDSIAHYNKFIDKRIDSLKTLTVKEQTKKEKKDSLEAVNVMKLMGQSKMFLWERAMQYRFTQKFGEKITVLDNRMAGLNEPIYEMLAMRSNRNKIPREINDENRNLYRFFLTDTLKIDGRDNFVIRFRQINDKQPTNRRKFTGYIYIDASTFGIKKIESNSSKKDEGSIISIWIPIDNKWFIQKEFMKMKAGSTQFGNSNSKNKEKQKEENKLKGKKFGYYVYRTADYFDHRIPDEDNKKLKGYTIDVERADGNELEKYRTYALSEREQNTYNKIDSVGKKYKLDQKAGIITSLLKGKIRWGTIDFDAGQILKYNKYEGFRPGISAKLNEKFSRYISPDAYIAYGFRDQELKYGAGIDVRTTLQKNSFFRFEYYNDVIAAGRFNENLWHFRMKFMNSGVDLKNNKFYSYKGFKLSFENDLLNSLTARISVAKDQEEGKFNYNFNGFGNHFDNLSTMFTLKYSPNSKNIMTPAGKYTYEQNFPEFYFNFEKAFKTVGGDLDYEKYDILAAHNFKTKIGVTGARVYAGILSGTAPIWHHFQMNGLGSGKPEFNFNLTSYLGFATMEGGKYYNDKFAGFYLTHRIPWYFKSFGHNTSSFDILYKGIIGNMKHPELHQFSFQKLDHLYQEAGFEWNNFLSTSFNLGFFYRFGYYKTANFKENFAVQLKFKLLGF